jgi:uncharacterized protein YjbI with pentapeptide repeats
MCHKTVVICNTQNNSPNPRQFVSQWIPFFDTEEGCQTENDELKSIRFLNFFSAMSPRILACMANSLDVDRIRQGVAAWNEWRPKPSDYMADLSHVDLRHADLREAQLSYADLSQADLRRANLSYADLRATDLQQANLSYADLSGAKLTGADVRGADLTEANLLAADLRGANFRDANLTKANLGQANLQNAKLQKADLTHAVLRETIFIDLDLTQTLGLETCSHRGPSVLDHRLLILSGRLLPVNFLRGCGVSESLITYLPSLSNEPIQFYSCFISYSTADQDFADRLYADLQHNGVRCWFAPHHIQAGRKIHEQLDEAIRVYDRLLLILSEDSMESAWVETEIAHARQKEINEHHRVLFPISLVTFSQIRQWKLFDADTGKDAAREIREYFIPDFSTWKDHDQYQKAFERVLSSLKQDDRPPTSFQIK